MVSMTKVLYLIIPFICVFLSTLFFFGYIAWFDNGFRHDDEYTLEELQELELDHLTKQGLSVSNKNFSEKKVEKKDRETSFMRGMDGELVSNPQETINHETEEDAPVIVNRYTMRQKSFDLTEKIYDLTTPSKKQRPDNEITWAEMTP